MWDLLDQPAAQGVLAVGILLAAAYSGYLIILRLRPSTNKADTSEADLAKNFEEMRLGGDIDDAELRKIKAVLGKSQDS